MAAGIARSSVDSAAKAGDTAATLTAAVKAAVRKALLAAGSAHNAEEPLFLGLVWEREKPVTPPCRPSAKAATINFIVDLIS